MEMYIVQYTMYILFNHYQVYELPIAVLAVDY